MTRFQKVASAPDYWDDEATTPDPDRATTPDPDRPTAVTQPEALARQGTAAEDSHGTAETGDHPATETDDHPATQPDIFGTTARPDPGETSAAYQEDEAETTVPDVPVPAAAAGGLPQAGDSPVAEDAERRPGEATDLPGDFRDIAYGNLIPEATEFRQQWQQIQFKFVDDPKASVTEAADVVAQVSARLEAAIQERQRIIGERQRSLRGRWAEGTGADTETLRETLRMYRAFLDQLLGTR